MGNDMTTTEEQVYNAFSAAVNSGDLVGAFEHATEDMKFRAVSYTHLTLPTILRV